MDGLVANLGSMAALARKYDALLMVDDSHGVGFMGPGGRGTHEHCDVLGQIDILTGTSARLLVEPPVVIQLVKRRSSHFSGRNLAPTFSQTHWLR